MRTCLLRKLTGAVAPPPNLKSRTEGGSWNRIALACVLLAGVAALPLAAGAQSNAELAQELTNPVAALVSVPLQLNYDRGIGTADDGQRWLLNVQPVVPFTLNEQWNLVSRTIVPLAWQQDVVPGAGSQSGLGDILQSLFFSPRGPGPGGLIWGAGPVFLLPTATDPLLGSRQWGLGPTGVALVQSGPWSYGALANHIWSVAGDDSRPKVNATFLQPFVSYTTPQAWTFALQSESTYNWTDRQWSVPVSALASKVTRIGDQLVSVGGGVRYWAESPATGAEGWGLRLVVTLLFPK